MTRIAVLSDIHGNLPALKAVVADAGMRGCDLFVNLGDILSGPLWPRETADFLMKQGWPTIAGNHERQLLTDPPERIGASDAFAKARCDQHHLQWLAALPAEMEIPGAWCTHARPGNDHEYWLESVDQDGAREATMAEIEGRLAGRAELLILHGHSHIQREVRLPSGQRIANPGSVGLPAYDDVRPFPHVMESGDPAARYLILEDGDIRMCAVDYDHEIAARQAERNNRPDWARALRTGRVS